MAEEEGFKILPAKVSSPDPDDFWRAAMKKDPFEEIGVFCDEDTRPLDGFLPELRIGEAGTELGGVHNTFGATHAEIHGEIFVNQQVHAAARVTERAAPTRRA